jgi:hypothetical protein
MALSGRMIGSIYIPTMRINNRVSDVTKSWTGTDWENSLQYLSTYYDKDSISFVAQIWNVIEWENSYKYFYVYDANRKFNQRKCL